MINRSMLSKIKKGAVEAKNKAPIETEMDFYQPMPFMQQYQYPSFASLFNAPQMDYSSVSDIYSRGFMPNNAQSRYQAFSQNLQSQMRPQVQQVQPPQQMPRNIRFSELFSDPFSSLYSGMPMNQRGRVW